MPTTWREGKYNGKPTFEVLTGINRQTGEEYWRGFGLVTAQAVLENIDALRMWVDRKESPHGHDDRKDGRIKP